MNVALLANILVGSQSFSNIPHCNYPPQSFSGVPPVLHSISNNPTLTNLNLNPNAAQALAVQDYHMLLSRFQQRESWTKKFQSKILQDENHLQSQENLSEEITQLIANSSLKSRLDDDISTVAPTQTSVQELNQSSSYEKRDFDDSFEMFSPDSKAPSSQIDYSSGVMKLAGTNLTDSPHRTSHPLTISNGDPSDNPLSILNRNDRVDMASNISDVIVRELNIFKRQWLHDMESLLDIKLKPIKKRLDKIDECVSCLKQTLRDNQINAAINVTSANSD
jgi:hypothetical protein